MDWLKDAPILLIGTALFAAMLLAAATGRFLRKQVKLDASEAGNGDDGGSEAYTISAVLGLLALLLSFTFGLAVDRFETRRALVLEEANAIGTSYLRSQALAEPDRSRMSRILTAYVDNRILLASARRAEIPKFLSINDRLLTELWSATLAANDRVSSLPLSMALLSTVNETIDLDASRKAARRVRVPDGVFVILTIYILLTAGILGYARSGSKAGPLRIILFVLLAMSYMLILDIDRPAMGGITEGQLPMLDLRDTLRKQPPGTFDRWRQPLQGAS
jgi:hypothetical protein